MIEYTHECQVESRSCILQVLSGLKMWDVKKLLVMKTVMHPRVFEKSTGCLNISLPYRCSNSKYLRNKEDRKKKRRKIGGKNPSKTIIKEPFQRNWVNKPVMNLESLCFDSDLSKFLLFSFPNVKTGYFDSFEPWYIFFKIEMWYFSQLVPFCKQFHFWRMLLFSGLRRENKR